MAFSRDGSRIATSGFDGEMQLWDSRTGVLERHFQGDCDEVDELIYSSCGRWILSTYQDFSIRLWDLQNDEECQEGIVSLPREPEELKDRVFCVDFSSDGNQFAVGTAFNKVCLFDPRTRFLLKTISLGGTTILSLAYSPSCQELAIATYRAIVLWDLQSDNSGVELDKHKRMVDCTAYSPCGTWFPTGDRGGMTRLYLYQTGEVDKWSFATAIAESTEAVLCLAWNPVDPKEFVICYKDGSVRVWRINLGDDREDVSVVLVWGNGIHRLCVSGCRFKSAIDLSPIYQKLLEQRDITFNPLSSEGEGSNDEASEFSVYQYVDEDFDRLDEEEDSDGLSEEEDGSTSYDEKDYKEDLSS